MTEASVTEGDAGAATCAVAGVEVDDGNGTVPAAGPKGGAEAGAGLLVGAAVTGAAGLGGAAFATRTGFGVAIVARAWRVAAALGSRAAVDTAA